MNANDRALCNCGAECACAPCRCGSVETLADRREACGCGPVCTCGPACHCAH